MKQTNICRLSGDIITSLVESDVSVYDCSTIAHTTAYYHCCWYWYQHCVLRRCSTNIEQQFAS